MTGGKVITCKCVQCKFCKNKVKNRNYKKYIKRLLNKRRRKGEDGDVFNWFWA
jgi:hypothetical protein